MLTRCLSTLFNLNKYVPKNNTDEKFSLLLNRRRFYLLMLIVIKMHIISRRSGQFDNNDDHNVKY